MEYLLHVAGLSWVYINKGTIYLLVSFVNYRIVQDYRIHTAAARELNLSYLSSHQCLASRTGAPPHQSFEGFPFLLILGQEYRLLANFLLVSNRKVRVVFNVSVTQQINFFQHVVIVSVAPLKGAVVRAGGRHWVLASFHHCHCHEDKQDKLTKNGRSTEPWWAPLFIISYSEHGKTIIQTHNSRFGSSYFIGQLL